jgi:amino acid transporter
MPLPPSPKLKRTLGLISLIAYGVGDILGAGIYALIGKVANLTGNACWLSFVISFFTALMTGLSYAELSSRFPRSAGESYYSLRAFGNPFVSYLIGFLVLMSGVVSMATVSHGFAGYLKGIWPAVPLGVVISVFFLMLTVINFWGMKESSVTNIFCTLIEVSGILIVILAGLKFFGRVDYLTVTPPEGVKPVTALFQGGVLAFYAFIGFEDMTKAAEESHQPEKFLPRAILISLGVVAFLYIGVALAAVSVVPSTELARSSAPLMMVVERAFPGFPPGLFTLIALFAVTNTALVNYVMGSRLLYGMAEEGLAPAFFAKVHAVRRTPHAAIFTVLLMALLLAFTGTLVVLAQSGSLLLLSVFLVMNVSLIIIKTKRKTGGPSPSFKIPMAVPILGAVTCAVLIFFAEKRAFINLSFLIFLGLASYFLAPARRKTAT